MKFKSNEGVYDRANMVFTFIMPYAAPFPDKIEVEGLFRTKEFVADNEAAEQNEFWDGELYEYKAVEADLNVRVILTYA